MEILSWDFGNDIAIQKLNDLENSILVLADNPDIGEEIRYLVLKRQGKALTFLQVPSSLK